MIVIVLYEIIVHVSIEFSMQNINLSMHVKMLHVQTRKISINTYLGIRIFSEDDWLGFSL